MKVPENMTTAAAYAGDERCPPTQLHADKIHQFYNSAERIMPRIEATYQDATSMERQFWPVSLANSSDRVKVVPHD